MHIMNIYLQFLYIIFYNIVIFFKFESHIDSVGDYCLLERELELIVENSSSNTECLFCISLNVDFCI